MTYCVVLGIARIVVFVSTSSPSLLLLTLSRPGLGTTHRRLAVYVLDEDNMSLRNDLRSVSIACGWHAWMGSPGNFLETGSRIAAWSCCLLVALSLSFVAVSWIPPHRSRQKCRGVLIMAGSGTNLEQVLLKSARSRDLDLIEDVRMRRGRVAFRRVISWGRPLSCTTA